MTHKATFAAGCFWGVEEAFRHLPGVVKTQVGYTGGHAANPSYEMVCGHGTGHAEAVEVEFDQEKIPFEKLLETFWESHDPTQVNRQGPDIGDQYRSAIFFHNQQQERTARASKDALQRSEKHARPIATEITAAGPFYPAEEYHQQYFEKTGRSSCRASS